MEKDFITVNPDTGSGNSNITVSANKNNGTERSTSLLVSGGVSRNKLL